MNHIDSLLDSMRKIEFCSSLRNVGNPNLTYIHRTAKLSDPEVAVDIWERIFTAPIIIVQDIVEYLF